MKTRTSLNSKIDRLNKYINMYPADIKLSYKIVSYNKDTVLLAQIVSQTTNNVEHIEKTIEISNWTVLNYDPLSLAYLISTIE